MVLMGAFAALALLLAAVGIYGVLSYTVAQRRGEIGVRLALGAPPARVRRLVVAEGMALAGAGALVGSIAAFGLARFMASLLFGVEVADLPTYTSVALLILAVSLAACYLPARRASAVDPLEALRAE
jgi:putative ABC transport system permease protein